MTDLHYENAELAALYDAESGWSIDRDFYLERAGATPIRVLDLGCGTGLLCDAYAARGHTVTGVDPTPAMLDIAREKPNGRKVDWVLSDAETYRSDERFDLIIMTGHAFQVMLTDQAIRACLKTMRRHLAPGGRAVFESRNPAIDWQSRWTHDTHVDATSGPVPVTRRSGPMVDGRIMFDTTFHLPGKTLVSTSTLRFATQAELENLIAESGLAIETIYGDWTHGPFDPQSSDEMIFVTKAAWSASRKSGNGFPVRKRDKAKG